MRGDCADQHRDSLDGVLDLVLQGLGLRTEDRLHVGPDVDDAGGAQCLQTGAVHLAGVRDLHPQPRDAGVDVDQVLPTAKCGDQPFSGAIGRRNA